MKFTRAERLNRLPPYLFVEIDRKKRALIAQGKDVINLGVGDPDQPTPDFIQRALTEALSDPSVFKYPFDNGLLEFREAIAAFHKRRHGIDLDPAREIWPLIGSKEGIAHFPLAVLNPGDLALIPEPGYPPYFSGTLFAGGVPHLMPLRRETRFLPDLDGLDPKIAAAARLIYVNYPNNPTGVFADDAFYWKLIEFAQRNGAIVLSDAAYSETWIDMPPHSLLEYPGGKDVGIEFYSLSKTFNMTGWRIGWAAGNADLVQALGALKMNLDSGVFSAIQKAAAKGLREGDAEADRIRERYRGRLRAFLGACKEAGIEAPPPAGTFYVWCPLPTGRKWTSMEFCARLLDRAHVVVTPGNGFGPSGEGYFRVALTVEEDRLREAVRRIVEAVKS